MNKEEIEAKVNALLVDEFDLDDDQLKASASLKEDLEIDSLDAIDFIVALEKQFGCRIAEEEARKMTTLGQVYDFITNADKK